VRTENRRVLTPRELAQLLTLEVDGPYDHPGRGLCAPERHRPQPDGCDPTGSPPRGADAVTLAPLAHPSVSPFLPNKARLRVAAVPGRTADLPARGHGEPISASPGRGGPGRGSAAAPTPTPGLARRFDQAPAWGACNRPKDCSPNQAKAPMTGGPGAGLVRPLPSAAKMVAPFAYSCNSKRK
jgi:hypothetical protein